MLESDLYPPIKHFLESQGYAVKAEICNCDVVAVRNAEPAVVVELKKALSLELVFQGVDRLALTDTVYIATAAPASGRSKHWSRHRRSLLALCRRLGLGLLTVDMKRSVASAVEVHLDPIPYQPRKNKRRETLLLKEFAMRVGDPNRGGSTRRPIVTAYRQDALRCAKFIETQGAAKLAVIREKTKVPRATGILQRDVYGWFIRQERGIYGLSPKGVAAMGQFADVIGSL